MTRGALPGRDEKGEGGRACPPKGPSRPVLPWISGHSNGCGEEQVGGNSFLKYFLARFRVTYRKKLGSFFLFFFSSERFLFS
jgi:hypothetical protein